MIFSAAKLWKRVNPRVHSDVASPSSRSSLPRETRRQDGSTEDAIERGRRGGSPPLALDAPRRHDRGGNGPGEFGHADGHPGAESDVLPPQLRPQVRTTVTDRHVRVA